MQYRIVMIGPHGERDYVEMLLDDGCPCTCGNDSELSGIWGMEEAQLISSNIRKNWLVPHVAVQIEPEEIVVRAK